MKLTKRTSLHAALFTAAIATCPIMVVLLAGCASSHQTDLQPVPEAVVYIGGWVKSPDKYPLTHSTSITEAIRMAGGYAPCGLCDQVKPYPSDRVDIQIVRKDGSVLKVRPGQRKSFLLQPDDQIMVPHVRF